MLWCCIPYGSFSLPSVLAPQLQASLLPPHTEKPSRWTWQVQLPLLALQVGSGGAGAGGGAGETLNERELRLRKWSACTRSMQLMHRIFCSHWHFLVLFLLHWWTGKWNWNLTVLIWHSHSLCWWWSSFLSSSFSHTLSHTLFLSIVPATLQPPLLFINPLLGLLAFLHLAFPSLLLYLALPHPAATADAIGAVPSLSPPHVGPIFLLVLLITSFCPASSSSFPFSSSFFYFSFSINSILLLSLRPDYMFLINPFLILFLSEYANRSRCAFCVLWLLL